MRSVGIQEVLAAMAGIVAGLALVLSWLLPDKTLFATLAGASVSGGFLTIINFYFGAAKDRTPPGGHP